MRGFEQAGAARSAVQGRAALRAGRFVVALASAAVLAACGGGGGGGGEQQAGAGSGTGSPAQAATFSLRQAMANELNANRDLRFNLRGDGTVAGQAVVVTGIGTERERTTAGTFEGAAGLRNVDDVAMQLQVTGVPQAIPLSLHSELWFDAATYRVLGETSEEEYCVATSWTALPESARVGDSGEWYRLACYEGPAKAVREGGVTVTYAAEADTSGTGLALLRITARSDAAGVGPVVTTYRVTSTGTLRRLTQSTAQAVEGVELRMVITYD